MRKINKPIDQWTGSDFLKESSRLINNKDAASDEVVCGAIMLAALREGTSSIAKLSKLVEQPSSRISVFVKRLRQNKVFCRDGKVHCEWFGKDGGIAFMCDVCIGLGFLKRVPNKR